MAILIAIVLLCATIFSSMFALASSVAAASSYNPVFAACISLAVITIAARETTRAT